MRGDFDEDELEDEDWACFEDTCVCADGMCGESEDDDDCADCVEAVQGHKDVL